MKRMKNASDPSKLLFFFTPLEELGGSNIFSKLSHSFRSFKPYLEQIDGDFIQKMNSTVNNIATFTDPGTLHKKGVWMKEEEQTSIEGENKKRP